MPGRIGLRRLAATLVIALLLPAAPARAGSDLAPAGGDLPYPPGGERDCYCPQYYDPVVCAGGVGFANPCLAACAKAENCQPAGAR